MLPPSIDAREEDTVSFASLAFGFLALSLAMMLVGVAVDLSRSAGRHPGSPRPAPGGPGLRSPRPPRSAAGRPVGHPW